MGDEALDPPDVRLLGAPRVVAGAELLADRGQQRRGRHHPVSGGASVNASSDPLRAVPNHAGTLPPAKRRGPIDVQRAARPRAAMTRISRVERRGGAPRPQATGDGGRPPPGTERIPGGLTASRTRVRSPVFSIALRRCDFTVCVEMKSRAAISLLASPSRTRPTISCSRRVRVTATWARIGG